MITTDNISFNKAILVDEKMLCDLHKLFSKYYTNIKYSARLKNGSSVDFDSLDELLNYENFENERIKTLRITFNHSNFLEFAPTPSFCNSFKNTVSAQLIIKNNDEKILIKNQINSILEKGKQSLIYTLICKISIFYFLIAFSILTIIAKLEVSTSEPIFLKIFEILMFLILFLFLFILFKGLLFLPISFEIGEQIKINERKRQLINNIFWVVIVGFLISMLTPIIL